MMASESPKQAALVGHQTPERKNVNPDFHDDFVDVVDVNERRRLALAEVDGAPFGWYHVRACVVAGVGFFTDSYDIFTASLLTIMLGIVYYPGTGKMPTSSDNAIKLATSAGTVIGQLVFGFLADLLGRKRMYGLELIVIIFATVGQALTSGSPACNIIGLIIFWRVIMGVGIGGDYPLSSIITSEYDSLPSFSSFRISSFLFFSTSHLPAPQRADNGLRFATTRWRGAMMAAVFAMQGLGQLGAAFVMLFITLGFRAQLQEAANVSQCDGNCQIAVDKMWRALIGIGAIPACVALYCKSHQRRVWVRCPSAAVATSSLGSP